MRKMRHYAYGRPVQKPLGLRCTKEQTATEQRRPWHILPASPSTSQRFLIPLSTDRGPGQDVPVVMRYCTFLELRTKSTRKHPLTPTYPPPPTFILSLPDEQVSYSLSALHTPHLGGPCRGDYGNPGSRNRHSLHQQPSVCHSTFGRSSPKPGTIPDLSL